MLWPHDCYNGHHRHGCHMPPPSPPPPPLLHVQLCLATTFFRPQLASSASLSSPQEGAVIITILIQNHHPSGHSLPTLSTVVHPCLLVLGFMCIVCYQLSAVYPCHEAESNDATASLLELLHLGRMRRPQESRPEYVQVA